MKNRVWISVYAGSRRFSPKIRLKKSVANAVFGFRHFSPLYDRVQKGWGHRGTSRLEGIETVVSPNVDPILIVTEVLPA